MRRGRTLKEMNTTAGLMLAPPYRDREDHPDVSERARPVPAWTGWQRRTRREPVTIRCVPGRLTSQDLTNACPAGCEMTCVPIDAELGADLMLRRGWIVELLTADDDPPAPDDWALFLGRLLLVDAEMRAELHG